MLHWQNQCGNIGRGINKVNDLILEQLLAIILQTNLQSHQLFRTDRQNKKFNFNVYRQPDLHREDVRADCQYFD